MSTPSAPSAAPRDEASAAPARPAGRPRFFLRRRVVVDARTQWRVAGLLALGLVILAGVQALALPSAFQPEAGSLFPAEEVHDLFVRLGLVQFGVAAGLVLVLGLLLSHRFSGAALVIGRALRAMQRGDDAQRLSLRNGDFLQALAEDVRQLREAHGARAAAQEQGLNEVEAALDAGDVDRARVLLVEVRQHCRLHDGPPSPAPREVRTPSAVA